jgi:hypothetical protein
MQPFKISDRQLAAFRENAERRYISSVASFLQSNVPEAAKDEPEALTAFVSSMVDKAKGYGLASQHDVAVYATTAYLLGENFEDQFEDHFDPAHRVLSSSLPGPDKAEWLEHAALSLLTSGESERE